MYASEKGVGIISACSENGLLFKKVHIRIT